MRENTLKQKLNAGKAVFGTMITFPSATVVEMLGCLGYDWILIDNEHGSITVDNSEDMIRAAELTGIAPIVRPIGNELEFICPFLDRGAWGVQVPRSRKGRIEIPAGAAETSKTIGYFDNHHYNNAWLWKQFVNSIHFRLPRVLDACPSQVNSQCAA